MTQDRVYVVRTRKTACINHFVNFIERNNLENPGAERRIILKWILRK
jgi:hypothetical protein